MRRIATLVALLTLAVLSPSASASRPIPVPQSAPAAIDEGRDRFDWRHSIPAGRAIEIKGVNGWIKAEAAAGSEVEVSVSKHARHSDPREVRIEVVDHADGLTICAVYPPGRDGRANECQPGSGGHMNTQNNDVAVDFTVRVPRQVRFVGRTVNGSVEAIGLGSGVVAHTVNGAVRISTAGYAEAATVNGEITASLGKATWSEPLEFRTVNGSITLDLPADTSSEVRANTVNGDIETDFPLTIQGRFNRHRIRGTIGSGGRELALSTVNGSIRLRRAS